MKNQCRTKVITESSRNQILHQSWIGHIFAQIWWSFKESRDGVGFLSSNGFLNFVWKDLVEKREEGLECTISYQAFCHFFFSKWLKIKSKDWRWPNEIIHENLNSIHFSRISKFRILICILFYFLNVTWNGSEKD